MEGKTVVKPGLVLVPSVKKKTLFSSPSVFFYGSLLQEISKKLQTFIPSPFSNTGKFKKQFCFVHVKIFPIHFLNFYPIF